MKLKIKEKAPAFKLSDQNEDILQLKDFKGKWLLIYFYPKDNTPGCTIETKAMQTLLKDIQKAGGEVLGVSADSIKSHQKFSDKFKLKFSLLADEDKKMVKDYGVWGKKKFMGREYMGINRQSFLIDPAGKIAKIYEKVKPADHAKEVLADIQALRK